MSKIVVCVCTRERPQMLDACLKSLNLQALPEGITAEVVVVDNEPEPNNQAAVTETAREFSFPLHYVHQPDPGIPQARNAALERALALDAEWIAFIDDDETAPPDWLAKLYGAIGRHSRCCKNCGDIEGADVALGPVRYVFPEMAAAWRRRGQYGDWGKVDGQELPSAATNNVIFRASLVAKTGLRFSDELRFAGGEDTLFFRQLKASGARIVWTTEAPVFETVSWERITLRGHAKKSFRKGTSSVMSARLIGGPAEVAKVTRKAVRRALTGIVKLAFAPLALVAGPSAALKTFASANRSLSEAAGVAAGLAGRQADYYRRVTGH